MELIREIKKYPGGAPKPRLKDIEELESKFTKYVFYKKERKTTHVITTCCHQDTYIENMPRLLTPELRKFLLFRVHNGPTVCPLCGAEATAKAMGKVSGHLYEGFTFTFLTQRKGTLYSMNGYACRKGLDRYPSIRINQTVKYEVGNVTETWYRYPDWGTTSTGPLKYTQWDFVKKPHKCDELYVIGTDVLKKTPFKYIPFNYKWDEINRQLTLAAFYPRQVEMLFKVGAEEIIYEMIYCRRKNAAIFNWNTDDPKKIWRIGKDLVREYLFDNQIHTWCLREYKKWQKRDKRITIQDISKYSYRLRDIEKLPIKVDVFKTLRYLEKVESAYWYKDYIEMAVLCRRDLDVERVLYPKDLRRAHDELIEEANLARERLKAEQEEKTLAKMWETLSKRSEKYNFAYRGYFARVALSGTEIREEGRALSHCVAGYVERHIANKLTILFIRKIDDPNTPLYTVEIGTGGVIMQAHGYRNEADGRLSPIKAIPWFFTEWKYWYNHGSKRDKDGRPIIKTNRRKAA